jgi:hypothetical protein
MLIVGIINSAAIIKDIVLLFAQQICVQWISLTLDIKYENIRTPNRP